MTQKWDRFLGELQRGDETPQTKRVIEAMKPIVEKITQALRGPHD